MYADPAGIFLSENPIFQKKNAVLADFAAGLSLIIKQNLSGGCLEGGPVPLRLLLRSRRLSSNHHNSEISVNLPEGLDTASFGVI